MFLACLMRFMLTRLKNTYLVVDATFDDTTVPQSSLDNADHDDRRCVRVTVLTLSPVSIHGDQSPNLLPIGDWILDADASCTDVYSREDGESR
jgi:hypothetical protein